MEKSVLYALGHSNHSLERFFELLRQHGITAVADVRSAPYSRHCPWFNRENLQQALCENGFRYVFLGNELGGKRKEKECCTDGQIDYEKVARLPIFQEGCERLLKGAGRYRIAILCSEKNPAECHRALLVSEALRDRLEIRHILADGSTITHDELMQQNVPKKVAPQSQSLLFDTGTSKEPVLVSACFLGIPCRYHGHRAKRRDELIKKLKEKYVLVPICPEQLGGMSTPRTSETLPPGGTGADVLDNCLRLIAPETGEDVTDYHIRGGEYSLEIAQIIGAKKAYLKGGSPSCDKDGIVGEILRRGGVQVVRVG